MIDKLIFVYNANSGMLNALLDSAHKIVSPATYNCKLCDLTYNKFRENDEWARFRENKLIQNNVQEMEFLHIDEFEKNYRSKWLPKYDYPVILTATDQGLEIFLSATEMNQLNTTESLIESIINKLKKS